MSMSGVKVEDKVVEEYEKLKKNKKSNFIQMGIVNKEKICVEKSDDHRAGSDENERKNSFEEFVAQLPKKDCRYAVFDFQFKTVDADCKLERTELIFVVWCPDDASVTSKMLYASSKDAIKKKLNGIGLEFQAADPSDLNYQEIYSRLLSKKN